MGYYKRIVAPAAIFFPFAISCLFYFVWLPYLFSEWDRRGEMMMHDLAVLGLSLLGILSVIASGVAMSIGLFLIYKCKNNSRIKHIFWQLPIVCGIVFIAGFYYLLGLKGGIIEGLIFGAVGLAMAASYSAITFLFHILIKRLIQ